ncbi:MAG: MFS transporter [Firmicutes bacterium]|nr:MFS transporter [Bacillota bacterium]
MAAKVAETLDRLHLGRFHYRLITVAGLGTLFDSMDVGIVSFVVAALVVAWHLKAVTVGVITSSTLVGMAAGAALAGLLADVWGRRRLFMTTLLIYSLATGLSGLAGSVPVLVGLRFLVGLGLGGELPVTATLVSEYLPAPGRGRGIVFLESFWAVGWLVAALVAFLLIPAFPVNGWRIAFLIGAVPALYVLYLRRNVPESPRYLERWGAQEAARAAAAAAAGRASGGMPAERVVRHGARPGELFAAGHRATTIMLWVLWFGMNFAYYGMFLWLPTVLVREGLPLVTSFAYTLAVTVAQLPGYLSAGLLVDRWGRRPVLVVYMLASAVMAAFFAFARTPAAVLSSGILLGFFNLGAWGVTYAYTTEQYPTAVRATGSGWAMAVGRLGGILGPAAVGWMLGLLRWSLPAVFAVFVAVLLVAAVTVAVLGRETARKSLEEIALDRVPS